MGRVDSQYPCQLQNIRQIETVTVRRRYLNMTTIFTQSSSDILVSRHPVRDESVLYSIRL